MTERNMLREGFIFNTLDNDSAVSGTQVVTIPEINLLIDEDFATTAVSTQIGEFFSLDADLGARWKLNRIELYTDETQPLNFDMSISDDGEDFYEITMTGSPGLYVGDIPDTVVSGAPRYIRYEHSGAAIRNIQEWRAMADDTLVDFGEDGTQTDAEIADAPIGRTSDTTTTLTLKNNYDKPATGFVVIEGEGTGADNVEISLTPSGPWFGRRTLDARMPDGLPFKEGAFGEGSTVTASGVAYTTVGKWDDGDRRTHGWSASNFEVILIDQGNFRALNSTTTAPTIEMANNFLSDNGDDVDIDSPDSPVRGDKTAWRADLYDTVRVVMSTATIQPPEDQLEPIRLAWRNQTPESSLFENAATWSTLSTAGSGIQYSGQPQEFTFNVGSVPTWSGTIRGLQIQPFVTATGIGKDVTIHEVEVYNSDRKDRVILRPATAISGSYNNPLFGTFDTDNEIVIQTENPFTEEGIITSISVSGRPIGRDSTGVFLCRILNPEGLPPNDFTPSVGSNFIVDRFLLIDEDQASSDQRLYMNLPVWWPVRPGHYLGFAYQNVNGINFFGNTIIGYDSATASGVDGGALVSVSRLTSMTDGASLTDVTNQLNSFTNWEAVPRKYKIFAKVIPAAGYLESGTYETPIIDGGGDPALLSLDFTSRQEGGSSIDVFSAAAPAQTVEARASEFPADTSTTFGRVINWDTAPVAGVRSLPGSNANTSRLGFRPPRESMDVVGAWWVGAHTQGGMGIPGLLYNPLSPEFSDTTWALGYKNVVAPARQNVTSPDGDDSIENFARCVFHHEEKDEIWLLNITISGTETTDARPIWDVYRPDTGEYIRTEHMKGTVNYNYFNSDTSTATESWTFEPICFEPNYEREEIYILTRNDAFSIGAGAYHGVIMDLEGNYKTVFFRRDIVENQMTSAGITNSSQRFNLLRRAQNATFDGKYFYVITAQDNNAQYRDRMTIYRLGTESAGTTTDITFIARINLQIVAGEEIDTADFRQSPQALAYDRIEGVTYYTQRNSPNKIDSWVITIEGDEGSESVTVLPGPHKKDTGEFLFPPEIFTNGGFTNTSATTLNTWNGSGNLQQIDNFIDLSYSATRDSLFHLVNMRSDRTRDVVMDGLTQNNNFFFRFKNHSCVMEIAPGTPTPIIGEPGHANQNDPHWGSVSGTVGFEPIKDDSVLFPTGRYAQARYTLNASPDGWTTPELLSSQITQGLRVENIPASGTREIYMRTNIPDDTQIGDQSARLKVFWELEE
jgi:hypothetical protein